MNKKEILDVLNAEEVLEMQRGDDSYVLVSKTPELLGKLNELGVSTVTINKYGDDDTFCILAFAFNEGYADECEEIGGKAVLMSWD